MRRRRRITWCCSGRAPAAPLPKARPWRHVFPRRPRRSVRAPAAEHLAVSEPELHLRKGTRTLRSSFVMPLGFAVISVAAVAVLPAQLPSDEFLTTGVFVGAIEEGARIFTPIRLLPFEHPEAEGHEFPNALRLHQTEYDLIVFLGSLVGLQLQTTLDRYPTAPTGEWSYDSFEPPPVAVVKSLPQQRIPAGESPLPGLRVVAFHDGFPVGFIVDTRGLTLAERSMRRPTAMGLDLTRADFLRRLAAVRHAAGGAASIVIIVNRPG